MDKKREQVRVAKEKTSEKRTRGRGRRRVRTTEREGGFRETRKKGGKEREKPLAREVPLTLYALP